jgi:hypothetical protein
MRGMAHPRFRSVPFRPMDVQQNVTELEMGTAASSVQPQGSVCGRPTRTTGMIARAILREAQHCEEPLLGFALSSPKHPSLSNRSIVRMGAEAESRA